MRQIFLEKGIVTLKEVCRPLLDDNGVLISVQYSFISSEIEQAVIKAADEHTSIFNKVPDKIAKVLESLSLNGIQGATALIKDKLQGRLQTLGYSAAGYVVAVGKNVKTLRAGDLVACAGAGIAHHADVIAVPESLVVPLSNEQYLKQSSIAGIGAIALQGLRRANVQLGDTVCVFGLDLLGQLTIQLAKHSGCRVIGIGLIPERLALAQELGADVVYNAHDKNLLNDIGFQTEHQGVDCSIVTAALHSNPIVQQAMTITRKKGKVVILGNVSLELEQSSFHHKEIDLLVSNTYGINQENDSSRWTEKRNLHTFVKLLEQGVINSAPFISETVLIENAHEAYQAITKKKAIGVILDYRHNQERYEPAIRIDSPDSAAVVQFMPALSKPLRIGIVGAGSFAKMHLMPIVSRLKNVHINAIVDSSVTNAENASRLYGGAQTLRDDTELFDSDLVDAVVIASPHKFHCQQALTALKKGKAVFMEKPMATSFDQLNELSAFLQQHPTVPFCVDYNRSFAPFIQIIKGEIANRKSPLMVHYRMNAGFIPKNHWIQSELGAGRIIGEACHIFDLFCSLTGSKPVAVSVESMQPKSDNLFPTDNFSAQVSFADGSVCTLMYTSIGHKSLGKERMELFYDSKAIVMNDFVTLHGYGLPSTFNETLSAVDKGHEQLVNIFFKSLQCPTYKPPIAIERLNTVAQLTLIVDQLALKGGGNKEL